MENNRNSFETFSQSDISIGRFLPNFASSVDFTYSRPYRQDSLVWCVQRAKLYSLLLNFFFIGTPEAWVMYIFGVGYGIGFVIYLMIQFDLEYTNRNSRCWHYCTWLIALPLVIGVNQRFHPKYIPLRIFYALSLFIMMLAWQRIFFKGLDFMMYPYRKTQLSTVSEIIEGNFRLAGSPEVLSWAMVDDRVRSFEFS